MRRISGRMLEEWGCIVESERHGRDGVEKYLQFRPDPVLMDLLMPIMNEFDASQEIMELDPNATIMLMKGLSDSTLTRTALDQGVAKAVIPEPFDIQKLRMSVQEAVRERKPQSLKLATCKLSFILFALSARIEYIENNIDLLEDALRGPKECFRELSEDLVRRSQV